MSKTSNWKNSESKLAEILCKYSIPAYRKLSRSGSFGISDFDVGVTDQEWLKLDSKYSQAQPFRHHGKIKVIEEKYCKEPKDVPILFTKNYKERSGYITIKAEWFACLLSYWLGYSDKQTLENIYYKVK